MKPIAVALAILHQQGRFLLQLRDDIPNILYPGYWGLFGGHLEPGETPIEGLRRELLEEINYTVSDSQLFRCYADERVVRHVFHSPLTVATSELVLGEGQDLELVSIEEIRRGCCYSPKANQVRQLGSIHQQILLDFIE